MAPRYFTLEQARALLPRVRRSMCAALQLHGHLRKAIASLSDAGHEVNWSLLRGEDELPDDTDERAGRALARARMIYGTLRESVSEVEALGVEVKSVMSGLIDFRSWCDGEHEVLLCYKLGEPEIAHFHGLDDGFAGRRSIEGHRFTTEREHGEREREPPEREREPPESPREF